MNPVISQIENTGNESYLIHEILTFGFIPFSFTYPVTIKKSALSKTVIIKSSVFKLTKIEMLFALKADKDFTIINEEILFKSPFPVKFLMESILKKSISNSSET